MRAQWEKMGATDGSSTYATLCDGFESVGGTNMQSSHYWASKEDGSSDAFVYYFNFGYWASNIKIYNGLARSCLAF